LILAGINTTTSTSVRTVTVVTPENITVTYQLAGVATRLLALLVDLFIQAALIIIVRIAVDLLSNVGFGVASTIMFLGFIGVFGIMFVYNIFFEMIWGGRTPGKRLFGLRVIRDGGYPVTIMASCIRNILRFIDLGLIPLPTSSVTIVLWGAPGLLSVFISGSYKRIGDYAAGTIVIHEANASPFFVPPGRDSLRDEIEQIVPMVKNIDRVTPDDFRIVRRFTTRRVKLDLTVQAAVAESIARPLMEKLDMRIQVYYQVQYADILEAIERRYTEENGLL
jgi:uncharacterized RDD family membrane protein YckC